MSYIYKIINNVNQKIYIGKTNLTIEKRWKEHCKDFKRERCEKRPLYDAMNKYGVENFSIEMIEECLPEEANEKERYWIEQYGSFKNGYNATKGGDGKVYLDYDLIVKTYNEIQNQKEVAKMLNISTDSVRKILKNYNIPIKTSQELIKENQSKAIAMCDKNTQEIIKTFSSLSQAAQYLQKIGKSKDKVKGIVTHISSVARGKRINAYGYKWKFI